MSRPFSEKPVAKFFARTIPEPNTGCLLWTGYGNKKGYGITRFWPSGDRLAHRVAWFIAHGPVPEGLLVLHRCDTPACVNVEHLFVGTPRENNDDRDAKGRWRVVGQPGERNGMAKISDADAERVFPLYLSGKTQWQIGEILGVSQTQIGNILRGKERRHLRAKYAGVQLKRNWSGAPMGQHAKKSQRAV